MTDRGSTRPAMNMISLIIAIIVAMVAFKETMHVVETAASESELIGAQLQVITTVVELFPFFIVLVSGIAFMSLLTQATRTDPETTDEKKNMNEAMFDAVRPPTTEEKLDAITEDYETGEIDEVEMELRMEDALDGDGDGRSLLDEKIADLDGDVDIDDEVAEQRIEQLEQDI